MCLCWCCFKIVYPPHYTNSDKGMKCSGENRAVSSDKSSGRSVHEVGRYTTLHIKYNIPLSLDK